MPLLLVQQPAGEVIDLKALADPCRALEPDEIVVCRARENPYRLSPEMRGPRTAPPPVKLGIELSPDASLTATTNTVDLPGGARTTRAMVTFKLKF